MIEIAKKGPIWRMPLFATLIAVIVFLLIATFSFDLAEMFYVFLCAPALGLLILVIALFKKGPKSARVILAAVLPCVVLLLLLPGFHWIRQTSRGWLYRSHFKAQVMAQPAATNGELRHAELDGWGFAGTADTVVYFVFDPDNSLASATQSRSSGKFRGIPCDVYRVRQLEPDWYSVQFYTDSDWTKCP